MMPPTISIVTPSLNHGEFLEETISSVLSQEGDFNIDYILMDGGSTDDTLRIIKKYDALLRDGLWPIHCGGITYRWHSEPDNGQADALNRGFVQASGDLFGWLNSDDRLLAGALATVAGVDWKRYGLCYGQGRWIARDGTYIADYPTFAPDRYSLSLRCTLCQPTVFFSRDTFARLGKLSLDYKLAFDYEYWLRAVFKKERFKQLHHLLADSRMYFANKSLTHLRAAEWESWQLRNAYYGTVKLNTMMLSLYRYAIEKKTLRQEKALFEAIGDSVSNEDTL